MTSTDSEYASTEKLPTGRAARNPSVQGLVTAAFIVSTFAAAISYLFASILDVQGPITAIATRFIDNVPKSVKDFAIEVFGTNDKLALGVGIWLVLTLIAWATLRVAPRSTWIVPVVILGLGAVGLLAQLPLGFGEVVTTLAMVIAALASIYLFIGLPTRTRSDGDPQSATPMPTTRWMAPVDRRQFFNRAVAISAGAVGAGGVGYALTRQRDGQIIASAPDVPTPSANDASPPLPSESVQVDGQSSFITPNDDFYRIDTAFSSPRIKLEDWTLKIDGMVDNPIELTFDELISRDVVERAVTLCCVSNEVGGSLIGNAMWIGIPLADLLEEVGVQDGADQIASESVDGWTCGFPTEVALDGRDAMIAVGMNGEPLPIDHGFPARLVVPGLYGYVSATKWLDAITLTTQDDFDGYWIPRGWSKDGPVKTQSRIDVPSGGTTVSSGSVAIAGVAWAQQRGIQKVEVRIDDGDWLEAELADEFSIDTWAQWVLRWDGTPGSHKAEVRATDRDGMTQPAERTPVAPDGATGYHTISFNVE